MAKRRGRPPKNKPDRDSIEPKQESSIPQDLLDRAKKIGISDAQVRSLQTAESLKSFCDAVSPSTNPDSMPEIGEAKKPVSVEPNPMPLVFDVSKDNIRSDDKIIESVIRKLNIKHNSPKMSTITKTIVYDCEKKQIVMAEYEIKQ